MMKKIFATIFVFIFALCLTGCEFYQRAENEFKLTVIDDFDYLFMPLNRYYIAGEEVKVHLVCPTDQSVGICINDEYISVNDETNYVDGHPVISFIMPNVDSTLYTTKNGYIFKDCGDVNHKWDEGIEIENSSGELVIKYTCESCGKVKEEINRQYTYKFVDYDGTILKEEKVDYGTTIVAPNDPERAETDEYRYEFIGWDKDVTIIVEDIEFKAQYKEIKKEETPEHTHTPEVLPAVEATCEKTGLTEGMKCSTCGEILVAQTVIPVTEHTYENGKCTKCDADDPNYNPDTQIDSLKGLKVSILGDSISTFYAPDSVVNSYYTGENQFYYPIYSSTIKTVDKTWWYQLINNNEMTLGINNSWSGSCAYGSGSSAGQSDDRINTIDDNGMPDMVLIYLGTNDCASNFSVGNFSNALKEIITKIRKLGDIDILITTLGYSDYENNNYKANRLLYNAEIRKIASEYECGLVPLDEYVVETSYSFYLGDRLHYNAKGAELLSKIYEKYIKEYYGIAYTDTIEVEHKEVLPEGVVGKITATANSGYWSGYDSNVYFFKASEAIIALYSTSYEITKNEADNKYYVTKINNSGVTPVYDCDYVLIISDSHSEQTLLLEYLTDVKVGSIVEFDESVTFPFDIIFK